jgi:hypothetical protein
LKPADTKTCTSGRRRRPMDRASRCMCRTYTRWTS